MSGMQIWYHLVVMAAFWLFAIATFGNIFRTGRTHLLDNRSEDFFKHFPGLLVAIGLLMVLTTHVIAAAAAAPILALLQYLHIA